MGRLTALQKPTGGVRGIVAGDILRRLVARTVARQIRQQVERATAPIQHALSTRAGCECIAHALPLTDQSTIISVDGIGAYDTISRNAMLRGLRHMEGGEAVLPFVLQFYGAPSTYLWEDSDGVVHEILHGEGGEQGDALVPTLFALGQHDALEPVPKSHGHGAHYDAGGIVGPHRHPNPPWRKPVVEQGGRCPCWKRRVDSCSEGGRPGAIVWRGDAEF